MTNQKNIDKVNNLKEKLQKAKSITFIDYQGLDVNKINDFRQKMTDEEAESVVEKNTLLKLAMEEEGIETNELEAHLKGPTAAIFSYNDPVAYFKPLYDFIEEFELPKVKFALIDGAYTISEKVEQISKLPSKEELLAKIVGGMKSPITGIVNVLGGTKRNLVTVLSKIADSKSEGGVS
jgi:large subunit ribosomal protein L10